MDKHFYKECKITDINKEDRTLVVIASDETIDRYNEIMIAKGCKYGDYLPFLWAHNRKSRPRSFARPLRRGLRHLPPHS